MKRIKHFILALLAAVSLSLAVSQAPAGAVGTITHGNSGPGTAWAAHFNNPSNQDFTTGVAYVSAPGDFYRIHIYCYYVEPVHGALLYHGGFSTNWELQRQPGAGVTYALCPFGWRQVVGGGWPLVQVA